MIETLAFLTGFIGLSLVGVAIMTLIGWAVFQTGARKGR